MFSGSVINMVKRLGRFLHCRGIYNPVLSHADDAVELSTGRSDPWTTLRCSRRGRFNVADDLYYNLYAKYMMIDELNCINRQIATNYYQKIFIYFVYKGDLHYSLAILIGDGPMLM